MILKQLRAALSTAGALVLLILIAMSSALAEGDAFRVLECYEDGEIIFASDIANIAEFDAPSFGVTLSQTISLPEKNADVYQFIPRDITCFVVVN
ncbi:MAG: hypothetical protein RIC52_10980 [Amphiplicatus sp.]